MKEIPEPYKSAHAASFCQKASLRKAEWCGCFYCLAQFRPDNIMEWADNGETAICPLCHVDSVLPMTGLNAMFLTEMKKYWFDEVPHE